MTAQPSVGLALPLTARVPTTADLLEELIEEVIVAEESGFDLCMVPEHRQGPDVSLGAPMTVAAALAARTSRIRIATGVLLAGVHHPVHLAEQVVALDHLSRGRFVLGVGAGYQEADLAPFGAKSSERAGRIEEVLAALEALLTADHASFDGRYVQFPEVALRPRPFTAPRPPVWIGAWSSPGVDRAVRMADGWIADPIRSDQEIATMAAQYRAACERAGTAGEVIVMREAWIDTDDEVAARHFAEVIEPIYRYYRRRGAFEEGPADGSGVHFDDIAPGRLVFGSPETCAERVREVASVTGADRIVLHLRHPGGPMHERSLENLRAFGRARRGTEAST